MAIRRTYFPTGIVTGMGFCDRDDERDYLKRRLDQNAHVVLMSPRRYGKSSLIAQFTQEQQIPFASIDLLPATSSKYVKNAILDGVTQLLSATSSEKKSMQKLIKYFADMHPVIELSALGQKIILKPDEKTHEETIIKALMNLDAAAQALNQQLIFVMDEFQQIAELPDSHSLEASIRHAVERSKNVFYIFSGSNRTLLEEMFKDKKRPLYHLCDEMKLNRISETHYSEFIQKAANKTWKKNLPHSVIETILQLTGCHPYYVNRLCRALWDLDTPPNQNQVESTWKKYVEAQKIDWVSEMISKLSINQRLVLAGLAQLPSNEPNGKEFSVKLEMPVSSIQRSLNGLIKNDLIYKDIDGFYRVLNPVIKTILENNPYFDLR